MPRGKFHFINKDTGMKTACGIERNMVLTTLYAEMVNCRRCRFTQVFWNRRKGIK